MLLPPQTVAACMPCYHDNNGNHTKENNEGPNFSVLSKLYLYSAKLHCGDRCNRCLGLCSEATCLCCSGIWSGWSELMVMVMVGVQSAGLHDTRVQSVLSVRQQRHGFRRVKHTVSHVTADLNQMTVCCTSRCCTETSLFILDSH